MSVSVGNYFGKELLYVAGAPRAHGTGQVVLFKKIRPNIFLNQSLTLRGEQFASGFGYELASADVNGDGYEILDCIESINFN